MLIDLLRCKNEAQEEMKRKKQQRGLRNVMFRKWSEMCYDHLNLSAQNLYDRAAKAERSSKTLREYMVEQREQSAGAQNNNEDQENQNRSGISGSYKFLSVSGTHNYADQNQPAATREPTSQLTEPSTVEENNARNSVLFNKRRKCIV